MKIRSIIFIGLILLLFSFVNSVVATELNNESIELIQDSDSYGSVDSEYMQYIGMDSNLGQNNNDLLLEQDSIGDCPISVSDS